MEDPYREDLPQTDTQQAPYPPSDAPAYADEVNVPSPMIPNLEEPELPSALSEPELPLPKRKRGILSTLGLLVFFILLFIVGVWLSSSLRQFLPESVALPGVAIVPSLTPEPTLFITPTPTDPYFNWRSYQVTSNSGRPISGLTFMLPADVLLPVCDGAGCISQGTYLPGGTRFTVAARGIGQALPNPKGAILTDTSGREFTQKETTAAGFASTEFSGNFVGTTAGGYSFSALRGYMIYLTSSLVLEISHFSPNGVKTDFAADDAVFEKIVQSLSAVNLSTVPCAGTGNDQCPAGYACALDNPSVPTAGGHCVLK